MTRKRILSVTDRVVIWLARQILRLCPDFTVYRRRGVVGRKPPGIKSKANFSVTTGWPTVYRPVDYGRRPSGKQEGE
jgi:hypothetical protein